MSIPGLDLLRVHDPAAARSLEVLVGRLVAGAEAGGWALRRAGALAQHPAGPIEALVELCRAESGATRVSALRWEPGPEGGVGRVVELAGDAALCSDEAPELGGVSHTLLGRMLASGRPAWRDRRSRSDTLAAASLADLGAAACVPVGRAAALFLGDSDADRFSAAVQARVVALCELAGALVDTSGAAVEPPAAEPLPGLVGGSPAMLRLARQVRQYAAVPWPVLVLGETGTGKEAVARAIHTLSPLSRDPFLAFNAGAVSPELAESTLFGHERGAFTGADRQRLGVFERVGAGTVFLDEVGELAPRVQVALLRLLQERTFERVGGATPLAFRGRVVAATHRPIDDAQARAGFRADLYHRLGVCVVRVPPLRERREDLPALAAHLLARAAKEAGIAPAPRLGPGVTAALLAYDWPGNVRELENRLRAALAMHAGDAHLPPEALELAPPRLPATPPGDPLPTEGGPGLEGGLLEATDRFQRALVRAALEASGGSRIQAAAQLGVSRQWLHRLLARWGGVP